VVEGHNLVVKQIKSWILREHQEHEMKEAADCTLAEVRRKISETTNCLKLIRQLRKLRQLRKDQAERKGLSPSFFLFQMTLI